MINRCRFVRTDGTRCKITNALSDDGRCLHHDPARADRVQAIRSAGGKARARQQRRVVDSDLTPGPLETIADCARWGAWVALSMSTGVLDWKTAQQTTNAINQVRQSLKDQHEEELEGLRAAVADLRARLESRDAA